MGKSQGTAGWLPTTVKEMRALGWDYADVILVTGDAYIDHPSFGTAVIGRLLEAEGLRVAVVPQPGWRDDLRDFRKLGAPRLFFGVSAGSMDSMVNHYTAAKRLRSDDAYTAGGKAGFRPDRAATVYTRILKELFPHTPVVLGGIEASLRRFTHYDYWDDALRPSVLVESGADIVAYGMGDVSVLEIARALRNGLTTSSSSRFSNPSELDCPHSQRRFNTKLLRHLSQVAFVADAAYVDRLDPAQTLMLNSYEDCLADKRRLAENFVRIETESNLLEQTRTIVEPVSVGCGIDEKRPKREYGTDTFQLSAGRMEPTLRSESNRATHGLASREEEDASQRGASGPAIPPDTGEMFVVVTPPHPVMSADTLDRSFELPYKRLPHPRYDGRGDIPAWEMIKNSVNIHRGCFGGCSFCTISAHQGKFIASRSEASVLREVERVASMPYFKGYISDLGGPSANMYGMGGCDLSKCTACRRPSCLWPRPCSNLDNSHRRLLELYRRVSRVKGVKKAFIGSGIRYDLFECADGVRGEKGGGAGSSGDEYLREVILNHTSGRLKVAPEHTEEHILRLMRKPGWTAFERLNADFRRICEAEHLKTQLIPYFISSHPGCTEADMRRLAEKTRRLHTHTEQVQDLTPTPMTLSSVMFYTGEDPYTGERLYVARNPDDKRRQKSYFFTRK
uniref:Putative radical SAM superfamily protein n=1 Tax=termite gut metagenome TaxID=433724 RepID=S0DE11_9ZZZZ